jgi:hypothetical protein
MWIYLGDVSDADRSLRGRALRTSSAVIAVRGTRAA